MKNKISAAARIAAACEGVIRRCEEIVACAEGDGGELSRMFSRREIRVTNDICCELLLAVAESSSVDDLAANAANFERLRAYVMEANETLAERTLSNPQTMCSFMNAESTAIDLLASADPTVRLMAGFAKRFLPVVKSVLTAFLTDIRLQLEVCEGRERGGIWRLVHGSLADLVGKKVMAECSKLFAQYGESKNVRKGIIAFLQSIHDKDDPRFSSGAKVIAYVRGCRDEDDPNFARCAEIRMQVAGLAGRGADAVEKVWHSLAVQIRPSYGRKRASHLSPFSIPDRSWA